MKPGDLDRIANWPMETDKDYVALMTYVRGLWSGRGRWEQSEGLYTLHASEDDVDLIESLHDNADFWGRCWESSNRHNIHVFKLP